MKTFSSSLKHLPLLIFVVLAFQLYGCGSCFHKERTGLLEIKAFFNTLINTKDNILPSWTDDPNSNCCGWERIKCSRTTGHVVELSLDRMLSEVWTPQTDRILNLSLFHSFEGLQSLNLSKNWFDRVFDHTFGVKSFARLKELKILDVSYNAFNYTILPFLGAAQSLWTLDMGNTHMVEVVFPPKELMNMTKLRVLKASSNWFSFFSSQDLTNFKELEILDLSLCSLKNFDGVQGLSSLKNLQILDLSYNSFTDFTQLEGLSYLRGLRVLNLEFNRFNNATQNHQVFDNLTKLEELDLSYNKFTNFAQVQGLANLRELRVLNLRSNRFSNATQHQQVFKNLRKLEVLDLSYNMLSSNHFLQALGNLTNLQTLDLSDNIFAGLVPIQDLMNLRRLEILRLERNQIEGFLTNQVFANWTKLKALDLSDNLFTGKPQLQGICELTHLQELDLSNNNIIGLPHCLSNLTCLRTLDLSNNQLNGSPAFLLSKLSSLEYLSLLGHNFEGSFSFSSLTNQSRLKVFKLSSNLGTMQVQTESSWVPHFQLKVLQLCNCVLSGKIPNFLLHQHDLRLIDLSYNKLVGEFPSWLLKNNSELVSILLRNNSLTKFRLPPHLHGLSNLDISSNKIRGSINESIGKIFPNLTCINISNNGFHGVIPSSLGEMKGLQLLDMSSNSLSGQLPRKFLKNCNSLGLLHLSNNKFQGQILPEYSNLPDLQFLFLDNNNFTGIAKGLLNSIWLHCLDISNNMLSGGVPSWIGRLRQLNYLWMMKNQIEGPLPHQLQNLTWLSVLDISDNRLSGPIPANMNFSSLQELSLQNNGFFGSIPDALFDFPRLQLLDLRNNNLVGKIPNSIGKLSKIKVLLLQKNRLQGHIPNEICHLRKVNFLDLSYNCLSGLIPSCLSNMSFGVSENWESEESFGFISIMSSKINWEINSSLTSDLQLSKVESFYQFSSQVIVDFFSKHRYEHFQGYILQNMFGLDLSSNELSGDIPFQVGHLQNIHSLNLSHNRLMGLIPESFSKLETIESLDLSYNRLDGSIPAQLAELNKLGYFNVSYNNLKGPIPFIGHLTTFDEKSYIGNAYLCGEPTNKSCDSTGVPNSSAAQDDDALIDMAWFYWTLGATYVTILLGLFVFLCIDSHWSREWFYRVDLCIYYLQCLKRSYLQRLKRSSIFK